MKTAQARKRNMDEAGILDLLSRAEVGQLATVGPDGKPYVIPVCFYYEAGKIYFHCGLKGKKLDNLRADPDVSFSVFEVLGMGVSADRPCNSWSYYRSVVASGRARIMEDGEKVRPLRLLSEKFARGAVADMPEDSLGRTCVVEVTIVEVSGKKNEKKI